MLERDHISSAWVLGGCLLAGLVAGGWALGSQIKQIRLADRQVAVKGLVERTVKADHANWTLTLKKSGDDLPGLSTRLGADRDAILGFLTKQGFGPAEVSLGPVDVTDTQTNEYGNNHPPFRYIVAQSIEIDTTNVDKLAGAQQHTTDLVQAGIALAGGTGPRYQFTGLNALKPDMITEATRNARASADRFAADSGAKVGGIRSANQGVFSITAADNASVSTDGPDFSAGNAEAGSIMKKIRVVSTINYALEN